jgi:hypothetical protein
LCSGNHLRPFGRVSDAFAGHLLGQLSEPGTRSHQPPGGWTTPLDARCGRAEVYSEIRLLPTSVTVLVPIEGLGFSARFDICDGNVRPMWITEDVIARQSFGAPGIGCLRLRQMTARPACSAVSSGPQGPIVNSSARGWGGHGRRSASVGR